MGKDVGVAVNVLCKIRSCSLLHGPCLAKGATPCSCVGTPGKVVRQSSTGTVKGLDCSHPKGASSWILQVVDKNSIAYATFTLLLIIIWGADSFCS